MSDTIYSERATLVAFLGMHYFSTFRWADDPSDAEYYIVFFDPSPTVQFSWHIHISDFHEFAPLATRDNKVDADEYWDGHTTEEKYTAMRGLTAETMRPLIPREDITP